jgi:hypothetical protein
VLSTLGYDLPATVAERAQRADRGAGKVRTRGAPAGLAVRSALCKAGRANTASARRAHLNPADVLTLRGIPCINPDSPETLPAPGQAAA